MISTSRDAILGHALLWNHDIEERSTLL